MFDMMPWRKRVGRDLAGFKNEIDFGSIPDADLDGRGTAARMFVSCARTGRRG